MSMQITFFSSSHTMKTIIIETTKIKQILLHYFGIVDESVLDLADDDPGP